TRPHAAQHAELLVWRTVVSGSTTYGRVYPASYRGVAIPRRCRATSRVCPDTIAARPDNPAAHRRSTGESPSPAASVRGNRTPARHALLGRACARFLRDTCAP